MIKKSELEFDVQDLPDSLIDDTHGNLPALDQFPQRVQIDRGRLEVGSYIHPGFDGLLNSSLKIRLHMMFFIDKLQSSAIRDDISFEAPLLAQNLSKEVITAGDRDAVIVIIGTHYTKRTRFDGSLEGWQK